MRVRLLLFGPIAEALGVAPAELDLPAGARAADILSSLRDAHPDAATSLERVVLAVNAAYARPDQVLREGDEVALIPPVSGG